VSQKNNLPCAKPTSDGGRVTIDELACRSKRSDPHTGVPKDLRAAWHEPHGGVQKSLERCSCLSVKAYSLTYDVDGAIWSCGPRKGMYIDAGPFL
jgi:hypothetical protein